MKDMIKFLGFILYATFIFFIEINYLLFVVFVINMLMMIGLKIKVMGAIENVIKVLPFIALTVVVNAILSNYQYAILIAMKFMLVCNVTYIYAKTTTVRGIATTIKNLCIPLKLFKINPEDLELLVCISLSMLPILKNEYSQLKEACIAKGVAMNVSNIKIILTKWMVSIMKRVNEIEESMLEKGYE